MYATIDDGRSPDSAAISYSAQAPQLPAPLGESSFSTATGAFSNGLLAFRQNPETAARRVPIFVPEPRRMYVNEMWKADRHALTCSASRSVTRY